MNNCNSNLLRPVLQKLFVSMVYFTVLLLSLDSVILSLTNVNEWVEMFLQADAGLYRTQGIAQTTKAICVNLARVETVEINKALALMQKNVTELLVRLYCLLHL